MSSRNARFIFEAGYDTESSTGSRKYSVPANMQTSQPETIDLEEWEPASKPPIEIIDLDTWTSKYKRTVICEAENTQTSGASEADKRALAAWLIRTSFLNGQRSEQHVRQGGPRRSRRLQSKREVPPLKNSENQRKCKMFPKMFAKNHDPYDNEPEVPLVDFNSLSSIQKEMISEVEERIGYCFDDKTKLWEALNCKGTGVSFMISPLNKLKDDGNRGLALLGDSVLKTMQLEAWRTANHTVDRGTWFAQYYGTNSYLQEKGKEIGLLPYIQRRGEVDNKATVGTVMEAIIGAIWEDGGVDAVRVFMGNNSMLY